MKKIAFTVFLFIGAISMIIMSLHYFQSDSAGILKRKAIAESFWFLLTFRTHIFLGIVAISIGPFQFIKKIRYNYKTVHKVIGYLYTVSVFLSGLSGLIIAQFAMGGWITTIGFSILSLMWIYTITKAITSIRAGDVLNHKKWMFLSYGLTFAAITQRTLLLIPLLTDIPFIPIYQLSAWLPSLINLSIAYFLFKRSYVNN
ncbi:DUF2306 domain-containing protein [Winogradskyella forsetii]|uniref:DUF2306 domain-containing protein n=1 Tax=Winogradskyella forsetii TaxID=2686077 RepID=UPI0015BFF648|nr:DUF2306 domain-containing protein [Winogradskyella forsetii]